MTYLSQFNNKLQQVLDIVRLKKEQYFFHANTLRIRLVLELTFFSRNNIMDRNNIETLSRLRPVRSLVRLSKQPAKCTFARPTTTDHDHSTEFTGTERSTPRDPPHSTRRSSNGSSNPSFCFRPNRDRCAAGAERYERIRGSGIGRYDRPANASGSPSESLARTGTIRIKFR